MVRLKRPIFEVMPLIFKNEFSVLNLFSKGSKLASPRTVNEANSLVKIAYGKFSKVFLKLNLNQKKELPFCGLESLELTKMILKAKLDGLLVKIKNR